MRPKVETPFTGRMRGICEEAPRRCDGYHPTRFLGLVENCEGDFLPVAKKILTSGKIQRGLMTLAKHDALDISMEAVVQQQPWRKDFDRTLLEAAAWRMDEARRRVASGEPPDNDEW